MILVNREFSSSSQFWYIRVHWISWIWCLNFWCYYPKTSELYLTVVLLYRENHVSPLNFTQYLQWRKARHKPSVVLVYFNENLFKEVNVSKFLSRLNFVQILSEPNHIREIFLGHIYLKNDLVNSHFFSSLVKSVHFSDHEPAFFKKP